MASEEKNKRKNSPRRNEAKWTKPLMDAGWIAFPSVLLERQRALGLDSVDINIILHLANYWWYKENLPRPGKKVIAESMGVDISTIRRRIAQMESGGLIQRQPRFLPEGGQTTNEYTLDGLIRELAPFAKEKLETKKTRRSEDAARRKRKRPVNSSVRAQSEDPTAKEKAGTAGTAPA